MSLDQKLENCNNQGTSRLGVMHTSGLEMYTGLPPPSSFTPINFGSPMGGPRPFETDWREELREMEEKKKSILTILDASSVYQIHIHEGEGGRANVQMKGKDNDIKRSLDSYEAAMLAHYAKQLGIPIIRTTCKKNI